MGKIQFGFVAYGSGGSVSDILIDANTEAIGFIFRSPLTGTITEIGWSTAAVAVGDTLVVGLQGVDAGGDPDNTFLGGGSPNSGNQLVGNGDDDTRFWTVLDNGYSATRGEVLAVVIRRDDGVGAGTFNGRIIKSIASYDVGTRVFPFSTQRVGGTWTAQDDSCNFGLNFGGTKYYVAGSTLVQDSTFVTWNSGDNPNEHGNIFNLPVPARFVGFGVFITSTNDFAVTLYSDPGGTPTVEWTSPTFDKDEVGQATAGVIRYWDVGAEVILAKDTDYYLALTPGAADISIPILDFALNAELESVELPLIGGVVNTNYATRNGGVVTETTTKLARIAMFLDQLDDGTGGGGGGGGNLVNGGLIN